MAADRPATVGAGETPGSRRAMENMQDTFRRNGMPPAQAEKKARELVGMVQGTMALEAQGLGNDVLDRLVRESTERLLARPRKELWIE